MRTVDNKGLFIPSISATNYGNKSLRFAAPISWNNFVNPGILSIKHKAQLKTFVNKKHKSIDLFAVESHWDKLSKNDIGKIQCDTTFNLVKDEGVLQSS